MEVLHIYTRVSTIAQEDKGTSLKSQRELGEARARALGFETEIWNEGGKSSNHEDLENRPVLKELINAIRSGRVKHIFVSEQSRLSRNDLIASMIRNDCKKQGVIIYDKDGKYDFSNNQDILIKQIQDVVAQYENNVRADRTRLGKLHRVRQNQWHGGSPPYGYRLEKSRLVIDEREADRVRQIFEKYAAGESTRNIKKYLDKNGVSPRRSALWSLGSIQALLKNTHYIGYYKYRDSKTQNEFTVECPKIITNSLWNSAERRRHQILERRGQINRTKRFYLLRDFLFCGHCGCPLGARTRESKHERLYYCPHKERINRKGLVESKKYSKKDGCGFSRSMNIEQADELVWNTVKLVHKRSSLIKEMIRRKLLVGSDTEPYLEDLMNIDDTVYIPIPTRITIGTQNSESISDVDYSEEAKDISTKIKRKQKDISNTNDALADLETDHRLGKVESDIYRSVKEKMLNQRSLIQADVEALKGEAKNLAAKEKWDEWFENFGDQAKLRNELSSDEQKKYLQGLINRIYARYFPETKEHELLIMFAMPLLDKDLSNQLRENGVAGSNATSCVVRLKGGGLSEKR